ncbi:hypothetical protein EIP91_002800 [Steccherinum ochraceum]|uniref:DUF6533 domain-containing protein n=1 Tax=Steccherinum ochraceum TaxID=92696 RepID=A0A4R0RS61_9APHY|nr:hypothetical protein EIP91_002800 [Steccherinum ochraceum]
MYTAHKRYLEKSIARDVFVMLGLWGSVAFSTLRIWAIWRRAWIPTLAVFCVSAIVPILNLYNYSHQTSFEFDGHNCSANSSISPVLGFRSQSLSHHPCRRDRKRPTRPNPHMDQNRARLARPYADRQYEAGAGVFASSRRKFILWTSTRVLLIVNVVTLVLSSVRVANGGGSSFIEVANAVGANLIARFILDLRSVDHKDTHPHDPESHVSTLQFGAIHSGVGNMDTEDSESTWVGSTVTADDHDEGGVGIGLEAAAPGVGLEEEEREVGVGVESERVQSESNRRASSGSVQAAVSRMSESTFVDAHGTRSPPSTKPKLVRLPAKPSADTPMSQSQFFGRACQIVAICLASYDTLLTFSREVDCVWRRKFSIVTVIFAVQRYVFIVEGIFNLLSPSRLSV